MRSMFRTIGVASLLCTVAVPALARPLIDWDPAFYYEADATYSNSVAGHGLFVVGTISAFGGPLEFLNASMGTNEYTFYVHGMTSLGTQTLPFPPLGNIYTTAYTDGIIDIYEDPAKNAVFTADPPNGDVPSKFTDGTLILTGTVKNLFWQTNDFSGFSSGNSEADIDWTGGLHYDKVLQVGGEPCPSLFTGGITWSPGLPASLLPHGYLFRHDGKIDLECPTPTQNSTWGRLKSLYR